MRKLLILIALCAFNVFGQDTSNVTPRITLTSEICASGCVQGRAFLRINVLDTANRPIENADIWLESMDKKMQKHFTTANSGLYETFVESNQFELTTKHQLSKGYLKTILRSFHKDSSYFLTVTFSDVKGVEPVLISEPQLAVPSPEPIYLPEPRRRKRSSNEHLTEKPVIYLYSKSEIDFELDLILRGTKLFTYPVDKAEEENHVRWIGNVLDSETIKVEGKIVPYLFWDGRTDIKEDFEVGFCVPRENTIQFLEEKLTSVGLNQTEITDFITYWAPRMEQNTFNKIHFYQNKEYGQKIAQLKCTPTPDNLIRLFMVFEATDKYEKIPAQQLKSIQRNGFVLVEWGGSEIKLNR
ncbi:MAG: hypothetical protein ACPGU5_01500 [Lishizhenia sp.]